MPMPSCRASTDSSRLTSTFRAARRGRGNSCSRCSTCEPGYCAPARCSEASAQLDATFCLVVMCTSEYYDNFRVHAGADRLYCVHEFLKGCCGFDMLVELGATDYLRYPDARHRYGVWYALLNVSTGE